MGDSASPRESALTAALTGRLDKSHPARIFLSMEPQREVPVEYGYCSRCRDNAEFEYDEVEGWVSVCCTARPLPVDVEAPE